MFDSSWYGNDFVNDAWRRTLESINGFAGFQHLLVRPISEHAAGLATDGFEHAFAVPCNRKGGFLHLLEGLRREGMQVAEHGPWRVLLAGPADDAWDDREFKAKVVVFFFKTAADAVAFRMRLELETPQ